MACAKRWVGCYILTPDKQLVSGDNHCNKPQKECPREPGEDYTKCKTICDQPYHAEVAAIENAKKRGIDLTGATATIVGHDWVCKPCARALMAAGIRSIHIEPHR